MDASVELVRRLRSTVVNLHTEVPAAHPSARILGNERMGSGTVIDASGLILTVNYVVMGGKTIQVSFTEGRRVKAEIVAQDFDVGLALLKVKRQGLQAAPLGRSDEFDRGTPVFALASTGPQERRVSGGLVTYLGEFEAYWEYMLDRGIVSSASNPESTSEFSLCIEVVAGGPTPTPTQETVHGDIRCDGKVDATDGLGILREVAGLPQIAQTPPCPNLGDNVGGRIFGDVLCNGGIDPVDALAVLRFVAGLPPLPAGIGCPAVGEEV